MYTHISADKRVCKRTNLEGSKLVRVIGIGPPHPAASRVKKKTWIVYHLVRSDELCGEKIAGEKPHQQG